MQSRGPNKANEQEGDALIVRVEHSSTHAQLVVHCGLGIGLAAGKCSAGRISKQGIDVGPEPIGNKVVVKTGEEVSFDNPKRCHGTFSSRQGLKSQRKHP